MQYVNVTGDKEIELAIEGFHKFMRLLCDSPEYMSTGLVALQYTNAKSNKEIQESIVRCYLSERTHYVRTYTSKWPWSAAIAYTQGKDVYFNTRKLSNNVPALVNTLVHEFIHIADMVDGGLYYNHGTGRKANVPNDHKRTYSAPYALGGTAEIYIEIVRV